MFNLHVTAYYRRTWRRRLLFPPHIYCLPMAMTPAILLVIYLRFLDIQTLLGMLPVNLCPTSCTRLISLFGNMNFKWVGRLRWKHIFDIVVVHIGIFLRDHFDECFIHNLGPTIKKNYNGRAREARLACTHIISITIQVQSVS